MKREMVILIADDDEGHARLIERNFRRAGLSNPMRRFADGQEILDFLMQPNGGCEPDKPYLLLLDIRMPKVDGVEVLRRVKAHQHLKSIPVIMVTTTDDPREVERCHGLGCNNYVVKPVDYDKFADVIRQMGLFISLVQVPELKTLSPLA